MAIFDRGRLMASALLVLSGFVVGVIASIYLFAVQVDLMAIPYVNKGIEITKDMTVIQNGRKLNIPQGTQMLLSKRMPSSNEYCILINSYWDEENIIKPIESKPKYFEAEVTTK